MLTNSEVRSTVLEEIEAVLTEDTDEATALNGHEDLHELGLNSLSLARLVIQLESAVGADPFAGGDTSIVDIRSVADLVASYEKAVAAAKGDQP